MGFRQQYVLHGLQFLRQRARHVQQVISEKFRFLQFTRNAAWQFNNPVFMKKSLSFGLFGG